MVFCQDLSLKVIRKTPPSVPCCALSLTGLKLFYASQIALQSALVTINAFQAPLSMRALAALRRKSGKICMILTSILGVCDIALVCVPPTVEVGHSVRAARPIKLTASTQTRIYRGAFITAITVANEILTMLFLYYCLFSANRRMTAWRSSAWIFRLW